MRTTEILTEHLQLLLKTAQETLASVEAMSPADRAQVSPVWLARVKVSASRSSRSPMESTPSLKGTVPVIYREARVDDAEAMGRARADGDWAGGAAAPVMARYLAGEHHPQQALPPRVAFLAEEGDAVVGFVAGHLTRRFGCDAELQWIYVAPERRASDIASALLHRLAAWFAAQGARRVCVNVAPDNVRARAFYARHGARELSEYWLEWPDVAAALGGSASLER